MKVYLTVIGFILFLLGMISLILSLIGLNLSFLQFLEMGGKGFAFLIKILMIFGGMILFYTARTLEVEE